MKIIICRKEKSNGKEESQKEKNNQEETGQKEKSQKEKGQKEKEIMHHLMKKEGLIIVMRPSFLSRY